MRPPLIVAMSPAGAWVGGFLSALLLSLIATREQSILVIGVVALATFAVAVKPHAFAASGALFGVTPFLTWGIVDGLMRCVGFNRTGGSCQADPTSQVAIAVIVYAAAAMTTFVALRKVRGERPG